MFRSQPRLTLFLPLLLLCSHSAFSLVADSTEILRKSVLAAYGISGFDQVDAIRYTFNIQAGERKGIRQWTWEPKSHTVAFHGKGRGVSTMIDYEYIHTNTDTSDTSLQAYVDQRFINDNYWLFFPFHLAWDSNLVLSTDGPTESPEAHRGRRLTVRFAKGGYTPGDMYELFIGPEGLINWWVFHQGGKEEGSPMTWEQPVRVGPLVLTTDHHTPDGTVHLWFSDIAIRMHGDTTWYNAQQ